MRYREIKGWWRWVIIACSAAGIMVAINQLFNVGFLGLMLNDLSYFYALAGLFLPLAFLFFPATSKASRKSVPAYDMILFCAGLAIALYFSYHGRTIVSEAWAWKAPTFALIMAIVFLLLVLEAARRSVGLPMMLLCLVFGVYPMFASFMPSFLMGHSFTFSQTVLWHAMGTQSVFGLPLNVFAFLLVGFMLFSEALQVTGASKFFITMASSLLGSTRGGPAKIAVLASASFGTLSGSVVSNILSIGTFTIPLMKKMGMPSHYAAAVETCASTGGVLMPPVMGAAAFLMASFLGISYAAVAAAAVVPSVFYYLSLFIEIDAFAAKTKLAGISKADLPPAGKIFKEGWFFPFAVLVMIWLLVVLRREGQAPFYATATILVLASLRKETRLNGKSALQFIEHSGRLLCEMMAILAGVGLIMGGLTITGAAQALSSELVALAGDNVILLILLGALTSFILGMGLSVTACYIFLVITLAPALIQAGLDPLAVHLFIMYCGMLSCITPPVAVGAFVSAPLAGAQPLKTAVTAMRLGWILFLVPFCFILEPALILHGTFLQVVRAVATATIGIVFIVGGLERYLLGVGRLALPVAVMSTVGGLLLFLPGAFLPFLPGWSMDIAGLVLALSAVVAQKVMRHPETALRSS